MRHFEIRQQSQRQNDTKCLHFLFFFVYLAGLITAMIPVSRKQYTSRGGVTQFRPTALALVVAGRAGTALSQIKKTKFSEVRTNLL